MGLFLFFSPPLPWMTRLFLMADLPPSFTLILTGGFLLLILAIFLTVSANVQTEVRETLGDRTTAQINNETITVTAAGDYVRLTSIGAGDADSPALPEGYGGILLTNATAFASDTPLNGGVSVTQADANWTIDFTHGLINVSAELGAGDWNVTYAPFVYKDSWAIAVNGSRALAELGDNQDTIAFVVAAVVVISITIFGFMAFFRNSGSI